VLTYAGAEQYVQQIFANLKTEYALPDCLVTTDEPSGDFGIAHFWGLRNGCASFTFDDNRIPTRYTISHEIGHSLSAMWNGGDSAGPMHEAWWKARGFTGTALEAQQHAIALEAQAINSGYRYWPEECFADTFGVVTTPYGFPITEQYGIYLDQDRMRAFYKSLGDDMFGDGDRALLNRVRDLLEARETLVWLARAQRNRDVETGKIYNPNSPPQDPRIIVP
jgi:hypothetical protein